MHLVLLHALPLDGRQWIGQMNILPGKTIAPTLYSFGNTLTDWATGALDAAGNGPLIVVGNSVGGSCALEMARQAPDRIQALVLVGTKAAHRPDPDFRDNFLAALENDRSTTLRNWVNQLLGPTAKDEIRRQACTIAEAQTPADLTNGVRVFHTRPDAEDVASNWKKPLVVLRGEHDRTRDNFTGPRQSTQRLHTVPDCGHYVNLEQPTAFNAILTEVVKSCITAPLS